MNNYMKLYWLSRLDNVHGLFLGITIFFLLAAVIVLLVLLLEGKEYWEGTTIKKTIKYIKLSAWIGFVSLTILMFIPTRNDLIFIYAGGKTMNFIESDTSINKIPEKTTAFIVDYLDKQINECKKETTK